MPPNFVDDAQPSSYVPPEACGISPEFIDPTSGQPQYELCLLARLESDRDPTVGEALNTSIRNNVLSSNNIVTRNTFLLNPAFGYGMGVPPIVAGNPSVILVANNNPESRHLNILFDNFTSGSTAALQEIMEISIVLSPDLWQKWQTTGSQGEGVQIIAEREVKITNLETAKLLNIPFDAREFQPIAIKVTMIVGSGKRTMPAQLPDAFGFSITHQSSGANKPSRCLFLLNNIASRMETSKAISDAFICSPNPFSQNFDLTFYLHQPEPISIYIYDTQGRLVKTVIYRQVFNTGKHQITIDGGSLPTSMYITVLNTPTKQSAQKVVKMH